MSVTMRLEGADRVANGLAAGVLAIPTSTRDAMESSLTLIEGTARSLVKQDTRLLMGSITHKISGSGASLRGEVGPSKNYGYNVEFGRKPGSKPPPIDAIMPWVKRHTGVFSIKTRSRSRSKANTKNDRSVAFLIARAIGRRGIPPAPFMRPALDQNLSKIEALFAKVGATVVSRFQGG